MDKNKPKSKALIITLIIILVLVFGLYMVYKNRDYFGVKTSSTIAKIFSPLGTSENSKDLEVVQAGEDIKKGDSVSLLNSNTDSNIVVKSNGNLEVYGTAFEDINSGDLGKIIKQQKKQVNSFWESFSNLLDDVMGKKDNEPQQEAEKPEAQTGIIPTVTVTASKTSINPGEKVTINWESTNSTSCDVANIYKGAKTSGSFETEALTSSKSYAVTCYSSDNNSASGNVVISIDLPDLSVSQVFPTYAKLNTSSTFSAIVSNTGSKSTGKAFPSFFTIKNKANGSTTLEQARVAVQELKGMSTAQISTIRKFDKKGEYSIRACADKSDVINIGNTVTESNENNNCGEWVDINFDNPNANSNLPDLSVSQVFPTYAKLNTSSTFSAIVSNTGGTPTVNSSYFFQLKKVTDGTLNIIKTDILPAITPNNTKIINTTYTFNDAPENYQIRSCVDKKSDSDAGVIKESNEDNNCGAWVGMGQEANIPTVTVTASKTSINPGEKVTINWESTNSTSCDVANIYKGAKTSGSFETEALTSSKSYAVTCYSSDNNSASGNIIIYINGDEGNSEPDLTASGITPSTVIVNEDTTLYSIISNIGGKSTGKAFPSFFTIKNNIDNSETVEQRRVVVPELSGMSATQISMVYKFDKKGQYFIRACADKSDVINIGSTVVESNEDNNCGAWTTITVTDRTNIPTDGSTCENEAVNPPLCTIKNDGTCVNGAKNPTACTDFGDTANKDPNLEENKCLLIEQNPIEFTDAEEAKLAELLRKYYIIAPTLKTEDDISIVYKELDNYKLMIDNANNLISQCYAQTLSKDGATLGKVYNDSGAFVGTYTGPTTRFGNPWYNNISRNGNFTYIEGSHDGTTPKTNNITTDDGKSESITTNISTNSFCSGKTRSKYNAAGGIGNDKEKCSSPEKQSGKEACEEYAYPGGGGKTMATGCTWVTGNDLKDYEKILNIW